MCQGMVTIEGKNKNSREMMLETDTSCRHTLVAPALVTTDPTGPPFVPFRRHFRGPESL